MRKAIFALAALPLLLVTPARADECAWNSKAISDAAITLLPKGEVIQHYCAGCNDTKAKKEVVDTAIVARVGSNPADHEVKVNGKGIDLAYVYVRGGANKSQWVNLGLTVKCGVSAQDGAPLKAELVEN